MYNVLHIYFLTLKTLKIKHTKAAKYSVSDSLPPFDLITYKIEPVTFNYIW